MPSFSRIGERAQGMANERSANKTSIPQVNYNFGVQQRASPRGASPEFNDTRFFENEEHNTPRVDYQDFVLFNHVHLNEDAHSLFVDADTSTIANQGSVYEGSNDEVTVQVERVASSAAQQSLPHFYDAVREAVSINEAVFSAPSNSYDDRSQSKPIKCPPTPYLRPLELWENTFERHESIAYWFGQTPHIVRSQQRSRQQQR